MADMTDTDMNDTDMADITRNNFFGANLKNWVLTLSLSLPFNK
jgi:hypothetical protein